MKPKAETNPVSVEILIVEDSPTQAMQLQHVLEQHDYQVAVARHGREALDLIKRRKPAVVISDVMMPDMDGYQLCRQIKTDPELKDIPVMLLTSLSDPSDVVKGLECGADNFITKPYEKDYVLSRLQYILINRKLHQTEKMQMGAEIFFAGRKCFITSERQQILNLLLSTYETAVRRNLELTQARDELRRLNENLEELVEKRTAALRAEILQRTKAEESLQENLAQLKGLIDNLQMGVLFEDDVRCVRSVNPKFRQMFGIDAKHRCIGANGVELAEAAKRLFVEPEKFVQQIEERLRSGKTVVGEEIELRDGRFFERDYVPILVEGRSRGHLWLYRDVTEGKRAEEALRESEQRFRQLAQNIHEIFWLIDWVEQRVIYVSPAYESIYGRPLQNLYEDPTEWFSAIHPEDLKRVKEWLFGGVEAGRTEVEYRIIRPDGSGRWILHRGFPIRDEFGKVYRVAGVAEDITERRQLEAQFLQAQKMEAIGRLAGGVAHDFNNLLTVIIGYSELVLNRTGSSDQEIEEIKKAGKRAASLTKQLLTFSRKQVLQPKVLQLNSALTEMDKMLRRLIGEDIELVTSLDPALGQVKADPSQIEQIILNLAVNSRDAMPRGGKLTIETANVDLDQAYARGHMGVQPGPYVMVAVSDTGTGMTPEVQARVFEPFFTTKEPGRGTGLGLSTVYGIIKQSGGNIWVYSEPGLGTTFKIYLPRVEETGAPVETRLAAPERALGAETILLVEDEDTIRPLVRSILQEHGYTVLQAHHGPRALQIAQEHAGPIHLMVTDVVMPKMNIREFVQEMSKLRPRMKILYISGYTDDAIVHHGVLEEGTDFMQKPFTVAGFTTKVREVLDKL